jgi:hypothetical protein
VVDDLSPKQQFGDSLKDLLRYFGLYFKNPLYAIKNIPDWDWFTLLAIQFLLSLFIGVVSDFFAQNSLVIFRGTIIFPLSSFLTTFLGTGFFYFLFLIFFNTEAPFLKLYKVVFLSHVPFLILRIIKVWIAPIELIGFAATTALLTVGFVENFQLPKKKMIRIFGALYAIYFLMWIFQQIYTSKTTIDFKSRVNQGTTIEDSESIEDIEKQLKDF